MLLLGMRFTLVEQPVHCASLLREQPPPLKACQNNQNQGSRLISCPLLGIFVVPFVVICQAWRRLNPWCRALPRCLTKGRHCPMQGIRLGAHTFIIAWGMFRLQQDHTVVALFQDSARQVQGIGRPCQWPVPAQVEAIDES